MCIDFCPLNDIESHQTKNQHRQNRYFSNHSLLFWVGWNVESVNFCVWIQIFIDFLIIFSFKFIVCCYNRWVSWEPKYISVRSFLSNFCQNFIISIIARNNITPKQKLKYSPRQMDEIESVWNWSNLSSLTRWHV